MKFLGAGAKGWLTVVAAATAAFAATSALASDVADFYRGKTVNIIVGFGPGGGYDLYARMLARHLGKHIPGNPSVVVQNMDGAGGVRAANHVYNVAPKDGTVIAGVNQGAAMYKLLSGKGAQYEPARFQWIGSMASSNNTIYVWHSSGIKSLDDAKAREVSMAGSGVISDANIYPAVVNALAGTRFKVISGYPGTNESNLAIERGEVEGRGGGAYSSLVSTRPDWLRERKVNVIAQIGFEKEPDLADVPLLLDLMKTDEQRQIATLVTLPTAIGYNHWVAPEVPADRVEALRAAYAAAVKDPDLLAEAKKQSLEIRYKSGHDLEAMVKKAAETPKPILDKTAAILGW
jgi:tripartite-type tricarboxylate transporter receptor subunit TctC